MKPRAVTLFFFAIGLGFLAVLGNIYSDAGVLYKKRPRPGSVQPQAELQKLGPSPVFTLTGTDGNEFSSSALSGKIWALNFFFTSCGGPCPIIMENIRATGEKLPPGKVTFVSLSVDPETDTVETLKKYEGEHAIDPATWKLLRGPIEEVKRISVQDLKFALGDDASLHSNRIVLVDREGQIRGSYLAVKEADLDRFVKDVSTLQ